MIYTLIYPAVYLGLIIFLAWQMISALTRIGKGVEDIAQTLRRIESKGTKLEA